MSVPRWMAAVIVVITAAMVVSISANAQTYGVDLPEGVEQVTIDGLAINATTTPQVDNRRPVIRGLLEAGPTQIELAVRPPDDLRWMVDVDPETGTFETTIPVDLSPGTHALYLNDDLIGEFEVVLDGVQAQLDLPAMSLIPSDVERPGFGVVDGRLFSPIDQALRFAALEGDVTPEQVQEAVDVLMGAGWEQRFERRLAVPSANEALAFDSVVELSLTAYGDASAAAAAFEVLAGGVTVEDTPAIADGAFVTSGEGATEAGAPYLWRSISFRVANILADIIILEFTDQEPNADELESLAVVFEQRINSVLAEDLGGLSTHLLRPDAVDQVDLSTIIEGYEQLDGEFALFFDEADRLAAAREARFGGATAVYGARYVGQRGEVGGEDGSSAFIYAVMLHRFESQDDASAWIDELEQRLAVDPLPGYLTVEMVDDSVELGDEAAVIRFTYGSEGLLTRGFRVYVQVGADIAQVEFSSEVDPPLEVVLQIVEDQVRCLTEEACTDRLLLSEVFTEGPPATPEA